MDVVVVSYRSSETLRACVVPLTHMDGVRVIVVDNDSPDDSLATIADLTGIDAVQSGHNGGFGFGCNLGAARGSAPLLLFLNPDARIDRAALDALVAALAADPRAALVGPRLLEDDGSLAWSLRRFPRLRSTYSRALFLHRLFPRAEWSDEVVRDPSAYERPGTVQWLSGACMLVRRDAFVAIGGFDEALFLYSEDTDLCARLWDAGYTVRFEPGATVGHVGGASSGAGETQVFLARSRLYYARKHSGALAARLEAAGVALDEATHAVAAFNRPANRRGHQRALRGVLSPRAVDGARAPSDRMRVLYSFPTRLGSPGIGTTAYHQIVGLAEHGLDVTVMCASCERPLPETVRLIETLKPLGIKIPFRALGFDRAVQLHDRLVALHVRRRSASIDVVHAWPLGAERTLEAAARADVRALLERPNAHTGFAFAAVEQACRELGIEVDASSPHARRPDRLARELREYAAAYRLLCPSDFVAGTFVDAGFAPERLVRHRYGYDPARFSAEGREDSGERQFTVGFVGRGEPRKGLHFALRAWVESGAAETGRFVIVGAIEPDYRAVLEPLLAHPSVHEHGYADDPAELMRGLDVLVLPSLEEGSALVTYEARACGCVLAVSDHTGAVATDGVDALVHPAGDVTALAAHLRLLATDPQLLARLRAASLQAAPELTWSKAGLVLAGAYAAAQS